MAWSAAAFLAAMPAAAADWVRFVSDPFEVLSRAGDRPARDTLAELEQVRYTLGMLLGQVDMRPVWPMRVVLFDSAQEARGSRTGQWFEKRDLWVLGAVRGQPLPHRELVRILLESNTRRMPEEAERGLLDLLSTIRVDGVRVTLGAPVAKPDAAWARMHLLAVSPAYAGRLRVLFGNLQQGADWHAAYKNAFGATPETMQGEVEAYLAKGVFPVRQFSGATVSARNFQPRDFRPEYVETAVADLLTGEAARAAYEQVVARHSADAPALEGLGRYREAVEAGSRSARCYLEFGKSLSEPARVRQAYARAAELNPRWAEPWALMASLDKDPPLRIQSLKKATELDSRHTGYWEALARAYEQARQIRLAAEAWGGAMLAARTPAERERFYQERVRLAEATAEKKVISAQTEAIQRRRAESRRMNEEWEEMKRRAAEPADPQDPESAVPVVEWWDDPRPKKKISGMLRQVECTGASARLIIEDSEGRRTQLLVRDSGKIVIMGGGQTTLQCGLQNPARPVAVEYFEETGASTKTVGEVSLVEFR